MFKEKDLLIPIGVFTVGESKEDYIKMDPYEKGTVDKLKEYNENGVVEMTAEGEKKDFDGYSKGDFFSFGDKGFPVVRSNEIFTKLDVDGQLLSFPNHKLMEGDK